MISIASIVEKIVRNNPLYFETLSSGIANCAQIARLIHPQVELDTKKTVTQSAVLIALTRLRPSLNKSVVTKKVKENFKDISLKTPIHELVFHKSDENVLRIESIKQRSGEFFSLTLGNDEITVICSSYYLTTLKTIPHKIKIENKAILTIKFDTYLVENPGLLYVVTSILYANNVNIIEIVSTHTELHIIIELHDIEKAIYGLS